MSLLGIGTAIGSMAGNHGNERRNYRNERNLMGLQQQNQMGLNQQGHDLQMDMWNKTNYGAQMEHIKNAGLNPALMYGMSGGGGTTAGSQSGGSAAKGSSQIGRQMDMSNLLMEAQIKSMEAKANSDNANADATAGYKGDESGARKGDLIASKDLKVTQRETEEIKRDILKIDKDFFKEHGLAPSDTGVIKVWKRAGKDLKDALRWLVSASPEEKNEILGLGLDMSAGAVERKINEIMNRNKEL